MVDFYGTIIVGSLYIVLVSGGLVGGDGGVGKNE
jgi:hypothetical protein